MAATPEGALTRRETAIVEHVRRDGFVAIEALARTLGVTPQTVRRDVNRLCRGGMLRRFHGGAGLPSSVENVAYDARQVLHADAKRRIAALVAAEIPARGSLFLNIGTTTEAVARALRGHAGLRVVTNNINVATILRDAPECEIALTGGVMRLRDGALTGEAACDFVRQFKMDFAVIGISGIDTDGSLLDFDYPEIRVSRAMVENARRVLLVADRTKFGRPALVRLGPASCVDALFTDAPPPPPMRPVLARAGVEVRVAPREEAPARVAPGAEPC
ncbi:MAG: DeoR family transcriptional regulator [Ectothiorhodospiraceae bacterium]|nr:DeoR family transcriptional regulator [Ectothiorhodospiraceae bacterium]